MSGLALLGLIIVALAALDVAAVVFGVDSRDGVDPHDRFGSLA